MKIFLYFLGGITICILLFFSIQAVVASHNCSEKKGLWVNTPHIPLTKYNKDGKRSEVYKRKMSDIEEGGKYYNFNKEIYSLGYCVLYN